MYDDDNNYNPNFMADMVAQEKILTGKAVKFTTVKGEGSLEYVAQIPRLDGMFTLVIYADGEGNRQVNTSEWPMVSHPWAADPLGVYAESCEPMPPRVDPKYPNPGDAEAAAEKLAEKLTEENSLVIFGKKYGPHDRARLEISGVSCEFTPSMLCRVLNITGQRSSRATIEGYINALIGEGYILEPDQSRGALVMSTMAHRQHWRLIGSRQKVKQLAKYIGGRWAEIFLKHLSGEDCIIRVLEDTQAEFTELDTGDLAGPINRVATNTADAFGISRYGMDERFCRVWRCDMSDRDRVEVQFSDSLDDCVIKIGVKSPIYATLANPQWGFMNHFVEKITGRECLPWKAT